MKITIIAFTENGYHLEQRLVSLLREAGHTVSGFLKSKYVTASAEKTGVWQVEGSLSDWAAKQIPDMDGVIFVGASGIAVRTMAPFIKHKSIDPAVLVLDEKGQFVISLLSGHLGGANGLAKWVAQRIGAVPVITTATDVNGHFAVDVFAKKNGLAISDMRLAKEVSALVLHGRILKAGLGAGCVTKPEELLIPELDLSVGNSPDGKKGTFWIQVSQEEILHLIPQNMILGVGCRRDTAADKIESAVLRALSQEGVFLKALAGLCSIDLKKEEPGLLEFTRRRKLPFVTYSSEQLRAVKGEFTASGFVSQITGVDNVCERSACLGSGQGQLIIKKQAQDGVTVACAVREWSVKNE